MRERRRMMVQGIVQGVGFRPFVYGLARRHDLVGRVNNDAAGVTIEVEGEPEALDGFLRAVRDEPPPLAQIEHLAWEPLPLNGDTAFIIAASHDDAEKQTFLSPDVCICDDCLMELFDPADRRYRYPFINCTNCGPRFTIIQDVPYDRPATTMVSFAMCAQCQREYEDPDDRRFHAQPNACPCCGPTVILQTEEGSRQKSGEAAIEETARLLQAGHIVAIKGLGGYHLACDALNDGAVSRLRARKHRWDKPFALMVVDLETAQQLCKIDEQEAELLISRRRPIVLLRERRLRRVAAQVAPREKHLGLMLPYTPLHYLLLEAFQAAVGDGQLAVLVMTSGNVSDEPIAYRDVEARDRLAPLADAFLVHNRAIHIRCDDAVTHVVNGREMLLRRSRGYVPEPIRAPVEFRVPILATGGHLKNTFCLGKGRAAFVSHHIGDLENYETLRSFTEGIEHFKRLFDIEPQVVAYDLHPEYLATKHAMKLANSLTAIGVQHHHAHIAAVTGEHGIAAPVIGVAFDGTGYGADGTIWGGEFLVADWTDFERVAHLETIPLIGGEQAIRQVWRLAAAWLYQVYGDEFLNLDIDFVRRLDRQQWRIMRQMAAQNINAPRSSAMGRLFDAVAALIGLRDAVNYEAQAAIELEMIADETCEAQYPFELLAARPRMLKMEATLRAIVHDLQNGVEPGIIAAQFHNTVAAAIACVCEAIRRERGLRQVALGGGVFQNALLLRRTLAALQVLNFEVFVPEKLPPNDGGLSFGQAVVANARLSADS
ncbi:MAG: carbamoyltransferase HypF [Armatimonadota bacterium]|nr:carbamoyltransferase HypF [Armatimonadota bacterium]